MISKAYLMSHLNRYLGIKAGIIVFNLIRCNESLIYRSLGNCGLATLIKHQAYGPPKNQTEVYKYIQCTHISPVINILSSTGQPGCCRKKNVMENSISLCQTQEPSPKPHTEKQRKTTIHRSIQIVILQQLSYNL